MEPAPSTWDGDLTETALLLIDCQRDFWTEEHAVAFPDFPTRVTELLALCRGHGIEVIHVRSRFAPDGSDWMLPYRQLGSIPCIAGSEGERVLPCAEERDGERVFLKQTFDALRAPELVAYLERTGPEVLWVAGLETSFCVLLTAASATQAGYRAVVVEDAVADDPGLRREPSPLEIYTGKAFFVTRVAEIGKGRGARPPVPK